jgi:hypothetical protein
MLSLSYWLAKKVQVQIEKPSISAAIATMPTSSTIVTVLIGSLNTVPKQAH